MYFQSIKGHEDTLDIFKQRLLQDKFEGVYLFEGPKGVGKYTIAKTLSKYITCTGVKDDSCWCESCKLFSNSPDFLEITSTSNVIKLSDIEVIDPFVSLRPFKSKQKVILIDDVERLNGAASNQLLKTLEDLKDHIVIFMISSNPDRIMSTILSRSNRIAFRGLYPAVVTEILKDKGITSSKKLDDYGKMIPYLSQSVLANYEKYVSCVEQVQEYVLNFNKKEEDDLLSMISIYEETDDLIYFLEVFYIFMNDILRVHLDDTSTVFNSDNPQLLDRLAKEWPRDLCVRAVEQIRPIILDNKKGVNIKLKTRVDSLISWLYILGKKEQSKAQEVKKV
jgi:hypothetical protein